MSRKFRPNRRATTDGAPREQSNNDNADDAQEMILLVRDHDALGDHERLTDTLTRHWAHRECVDFNLALQMSQTHWEAER